MNRCFSCRNNRRQLLMLKCGHDVCIKCAADNYFINCKNKLNPKRSRQSNYFCEKCLEQTELEQKTVEQLKKYFLENVNVEEKHKTGRRERLIQREQNERQRLERVNRLDVQNSSRPKSQQIQISERKRTLSKYLSDKQVDKFMEMQQEYQQAKTVQPLPEHQFTLGSGEKFAQRKSEKFSNNEYELTGAGYEGRRNKDSVIYSGRQIRPSNVYDRVGAEMVRVKSQQYNQGRKNKHKSRMQSKMVTAQDMEYQLYHNGKAVLDYDPQAADYLLQERRQIPSNSKSKFSSVSSGKAVGKIKSKKSPNPHDSVVPLPMLIEDHQGYTYTERMEQSGRQQRIDSWKSDSKVRHAQTYCNQTQMPREGVNMKNTSSSAEWEIDSKQTRRCEDRTVAHCRGGETMQKILDNLQYSQPKLSKIKQKSAKDENSRSRIQPEQLRHEIYLCKVHEDEQIIYFCLKCNQLICSECALRGSHKQHQIYSLKKSGQLLRQTLVHKVNTFNKLMLQEESKEKIFKECINQIGLQAGRQREKVKSSFEGFIFQVDKKYKEVLKEIEDKFGTASIEYMQKLNESRNNYVSYSKMKDQLSQTLDEYVLEEPGENQANLTPASNQLGNFHKTHKFKANPSHAGIECIHKLICKINEASEFLKSSNGELLSSKRGSLLSQRSSLKLSDSEILLDDEEMDAITTPTTNTPLRRSGDSPTKRNKKIIMGAYCLNVSTRVKLLKCQALVEGLVEMQSIVKALRLQIFDYGLKALA